MSLYNSIIRPILFETDAERVHEFSIEALRYGLSFDFAQRIAARRHKAETLGRIDRFGLTLSLIHI